MERIDKIIASALNVTRSEAKSLIKQKQVQKNGVPVKSADEKADLQADRLTVSGREIEYNRYVYIMMNKPKGVISSTDGSKTGEKTVLDILPPEFVRRGLFPAGRLDKDTTGFMLITDDGEFAHNILSPKKHIEKTYLAVLDKPVQPEDIAAFESGIELGEERCLPAQLMPVSEDCKIAQAVISQGMYHQVKRMFAARGIKVLELKRTKMGALELDASLAEGECRFIKNDELALIIEQN